MALDAVVHLIDDDDGVRQALAFMLPAFPSGCTNQPLPFWMQFRACSRAAS
jgi:hypothetical protein